MANTYKISDGGDTILITTVESDTEFIDTYVPKSLIVYEVQYYMDSNGVKTVKKIRFIPVGNYFFGDLRDGVGLIYLQDGDGNAFADIDALIAYFTFINFFRKAATGGGTTTTPDPNATLTNAQTVGVNNIITSRGLASISQINDELDALDATDFQVIDATLPDPILSSLPLAPGDNLQVAATKLQQQSTENIRKIAGQNKAKFFEKIRQNSAFTICWEGTSLAYGQDVPSGSGTLNGATQTRTTTPPPEQMAIVLTQAGLSPTVTNHGYPGDRTNDGINRWYNSARVGASGINVDTTTNVNLVNDILSPKNSYDAVIISYSHNDANNYGTKTSGIVPISNFKENLRAMILARLNDGSYVCLGIDVLPLIYSGGLTSAHANLNHYRSAILELSLQYGLTVIDFQQILQPLFPVWQADATHLLPAAYNHMGCMAAGYFFADYIPKVAAGDSYYFWDQLFPYTSVTVNANSTKGSLMAMSTSKSYALVFEVIGESVELCFKSYNLNSTGFNVSYGNNNSGISDVLIPAVSSLKKSRTAMIFPKGRHFVILSNLSATNQTFPDEISFKAARDPNVTIIADADYVVTLIRPGGIFLDNLMTAGRNLAFPSEQGRDGDHFIWANLTAFARTVTTTNLKTKAGATITSLTANTIYTFHAFNSNFYQTA